MPVIIDPNKSFSFQDFEDAAWGAKVSISPSALKRVQASYKTLLTIVKRGDIKIYGLHTGFGALQGSLSAGNWGQHQRDLIVSHACGVGEPMEEAEARGMVYLRAVEISRGTSGISPKTFEKYAGLLSGKKMPAIPSQGSVGACGDLMPLAHAAKAVIAQMQDADLGPRDGLALINGTEASTSVSLLAGISAQRLMERAIAVSALSLFALKGRTEAWEDEVVGLKKHPGSLSVARKALQYLGSYRAQGLPQDPYSVRAFPQVSGCAYEMIMRALETLALEASSVTDNPAILNAETVRYGANFHGVYPASAADSLALALHTLAQMSERRTVVLLSGNRDLPKMLSAKNGSSGLMETQVVQAALLADSRILTQPASAGSISTNGEQEDVVPMAMGAALKLKRCVFHFSRILAIEAIASGRAIVLTNRTSELKAKTQLQDFWKELEQSSGKLLRRDDADYSRSIEETASMLRGRYVSRAG